MPAYRFPVVPLNRTVMSLVPVPVVSLGRMQFKAHVLPPPPETKIGARLRPQNPRLGVKAEPAIRVGSAGSTAKLGSLSWLVSKLRSRGIILTTVTCAAFPILVPATTERAAYNTANGQRACFILPPRRYDPAVICGGPLTGRQPS